MNNMIKRLVDYFTKNKRQRAKAKFHRKAKSEDDPKRYFRG